MTAPAKRLQMIQQAKRRLAKTFPSAVMETPQFKALVEESIDSLLALSKAAKGFDGSRAAAVALAEAASAYVALLDSIGRVGEEVFRELRRSDSKAPTPH